ncbi:MAG: metallophosphoesterase family protein [Acidimicrobiales bacterium]
MAFPKDQRNDFCFVHAADLHLDTPFKGIGATTPAVAAALREASLEAFDNLVALCLARRAAFLLIAGDIYDGADRGIRAQLRFRSGLDRLSQAGIATLVVHGNHDPVDSGWSAVTDWPPLVTIFRTTEVDAVPVVVDGIQLARVQGISYWRRDVTENLALRFSARSGPGLQVGLLHCNLRGVGEGHRDYSPCSVEDLTKVGLDYWALGHIHSRAVLSGRPYGDAPWIVYPGNLQARSPKPSERGPKGAVVVEVRGGDVAGIEFVACDRIRFATVGVDLNPLRSLDSVRDALEGAARSELEAADGRSIVVRAVLSGRSEIHQALKKGHASSELLEALRDGFETSGPWIWWDRVEDVSEPLIDLEQLKQGTDFAANLISLAGRLSSACPGHGEGTSLDSNIPGDLLEEITASLPKALRARARALDITGDELLSLALLTALDELGVTAGPTGGGG